MAEDSRLQEQANRGDRAKRLLEDDLIQEAFQKIEAEIERGWKNSKHPGERENAYYLWRALESFRKKLENVVQHGETAKKTLFGKRLS